MNEFTRKQRLQPLLDEYATQAIPDDLDLRATLHAHLRQYSPIRRLARTVRTLRNVVLVSSLMIVLGIAGFILVNIPRPLSSAPNDPRPAQQVPPTPLPLMSKTLDQYTLTIQPILADANRVVLTYTVDGPPDPTNLTAAKPYVAWSDGAKNFMPQLTDSTGQNYPFLSDSSWSINTNGKTVNVGLMGSTTFPIMFDTSVHRDLPAVLHLHLVADIGFYRQLQGPVKAAGPFTFDFIMPMDPIRRVAEINQTVNGIKGALTLEKVIVTRMETRAFFHFNLSDVGISTDGAPNVLLQIGDWTSQRDGKPVGLEGPGAVSKTTWTYSFLSSLLDQPGDWTMNVQDLPLYGSAAPQLAGPWVFHFKMP